MGLGAVSGLDVRFYFILIRGPGRCIGTNGVVVVAVTPGADYAFGSSSAYETALGGYSPFRAHFDFVVRR